MWDVCELVVFNNIAKPPNVLYLCQKHPMGDAPFIGPRLGDDYMYMSPSHSHVHVTQYRHYKEAFLCLVCITINVCNLQFSALPVRAQVL